MTSNDALRTLIASGTKLWVDSVDPDLVRENLAQGATGATSNPVIVTDLIKTGRFDASIERLLEAGHPDDDIAWALTDELVRNAQEQFSDVWERTGGDDGYVSFEVDPLLEDPDGHLSHDERVRSYIALGKRWAEGHQNRLIKVPATRAGLAALEELAAGGVKLNVTLIFTDRQYQAARDAIWRGAQRHGKLAGFKSVYSIFVSRIDVYTEQHVPQLSDAAQGLVGIVNAKRIWRKNQEFWASHDTPLKQEMVFASTGTKKPEDAPWKYVAAFAGSDIETNPPATNAAAAKSDQSFDRHVDQLPPDSVLQEIDDKVDFTHLEQVLMDEGIRKFADPQKGLLRLLAEKRASLTST